MKPAEPKWRTSSYTGTENCVEVADNDPRRIMVRDTKDRDGGTLAFPPSSWTPFVGFAAGVRLPE
ncbi:DUF397 domain-containing protein [Streptomyces lincolnensis]|uniref:DUF397 domain-containing protein n=1 Tax=Streptomyces lincolnensis TaxID=1915 RepID=UPI001E5160D0|nr:DUF397 domain-containing protein [Streptomyces lincolnensis]MCD7438955.1 DUF397 domain-containing protein [Streptomyces lincolnensis]